MTAMLAAGPEGTLSAGWEFPVKVSAALALERLQPQRQQRAGGHRPAGVRQQVPGDGAWFDDRVAPVVEADPLRQQFGAEAAAVTPGAVDPELQPLAHP